MKICFNCGNKMNDKDMFCSQCGTKYAPAKVYKKSGWLTALIVITILVILICLYIKDPSLTTVKTWFETGFNG